MLRAIEEINGSELLDDFTLLHHCDPVADELNHGEVMSDEDHGAAEFGLQVSEKLQHLGLNADIKRSDGFIGQNK